MTDPVKKIGDAVLAREVIEKFAQGEDCAEYIDEEELGLGSPESGRSEPEDLLCHVFHSATDDDVSDVVEPGEKLKLQAAGFAPEFIAELAGPDGRRALRERAKWLADHIVAPWYRPNLPAHERQKMVDELRDYGRDAAVALPPLLEIMEDYSSVDSMNEDDYRLLSKVTDVLENMGPKAKAAIPYMKKIYQRLESADFPRAVAQILVNDVDILLEDLSDENSKIRRLASSALGLMNWESAKSNSEKIVPALRAALILTEVYWDPQTENQTRSNIIYALLKIKEDKGALALFEDLLRRDPESYLVSDIVYLKAELGRRALPFLFRGLKSPNFGEDVVIAIRAIGLEVEDIQPLIAEMSVAHLHLDDHFVLKLALAEIGPPAVRPLVQILKEADGTRFDLAADILGWLGKKAAGAAPELYALARDFKKKSKELKSVNENDIERAGASLGKAVDIMGIFRHMGSEAVPILVGGLKENDPDMTYFCLSSIRDIGKEAKEAVSEVLPFLDDPSPFLRSTAVFTLEAIAPEDSEVLMKIIAALQDAHSDVRWSAAFTLRELAFKNVNAPIYLALPLLVAMRDNVREEERVRKTAGDAVQAIEEKVL